MLVVSYKLICTNGLIHPKQEDVLSNQKHIGIHIDGFIAGINGNKQELSNYISKVYAFERIST